MKAILLLPIPLIGLGAINDDDVWNRCITCLFVVTGLRVFPIASPRSNKQQIKEFTCRYIEKSYKDEFVEECEEIVDEIYGSESKEREVRVSSLVICYFLLAYVCVQKCKFCSQWTERHMRHQPHFSVSHSIPAIGRLGSARKDCPKTTAEFRTAMSDSELELLESSFEGLANDDDDYEGMGADIPLVVPLEDSSDDEDGDGDQSDDNDSDGWTEEVTAHDKWVLNECSGISDDVLENCKEPFHHLFSNDDVLNLIVQETNKYAQAKDPRNWEDTDKAEIRKFHQTGLWRPPYRCKSNVKEQFEKLLANIHLNDNSLFDGSNRLHDVLPYLDLFNGACQRVYHLDSDLCIDESLNPFRGRIFFKQYIPNKRHRYGIKLFKLCCNGGYTHRTRVYAGKDFTRTGTIDESVVLSLVDSLLDQGRRLFTDNYYTSVPLAEELVKGKTHLTGTIGKKKKRLPKAITARKLKRGVMVAQQNRRGITVLKCRDRRDVLMLSTTHDDSNAGQGKPKIELRDVKDCREKDVSAAIKNCLRRKDLTMPRSMQEKYTQNAVIARNTSA
ncbi:hypothetical protein ANCCEY_07757 [Ancylostoma ceylanicum]|uniref:PiggyBac transposable element-derived protein domain-containing protein n=1 Tax=Ancylostoma ceylanicum TaxID=53326 RepID=A0A0D6LMR8_9BILA|nr:hypothetical protein ANCCEY_07757 [Ancylostoma ceylanicum]